MSNIENEIDALRAAIGASNDAQLVEMLGYSHGAISQWRRRGSIPEKAKQKVAAYREGGSRLLKMQARRRYLGNQVLYEGRCLALLLAPSIDSVGKRFSIANYMGSLRNFASLFEDIELACADLIYDRRERDGGNATDAFDRLTQEDLPKLYDAIIDRAMRYRHSEVELIEGPELE